MIGESEFSVIGGGALLTFVIHQCFGSSAISFYGWVDVARSREEFYDQLVPRSSGSGHPIQSDVEGTPMIAQERYPNEHRRQSSLSRAWGWRSLQRFISPRLRQEHDVIATLPAEVAHPSTAKLRQCSVHCTRQLFSAQQRRRSRTAYRHITPLSRIT